MRPARLIVPALEHPASSDVRLARIARFSGVTCETIPLNAAIHAARGGARGIGRDACVVINAAVLREAQGDTPEAIASAETLIKGWPFALVHGLEPDPFSESLVRTLSVGTLHGIGAAAPGAAYSVSAGAGEPLAGLTFGPARAGDRVFHGHQGAPDRILASIGREPALASRSCNGTETVFLASGVLADLDGPAPEMALAPYFSRLVLPVMALRHLFGDRCWRPRQCHASLIIDDPVLWRRFGFLHFDRVLDLLDEHDFHLSVAFIPYNHRRGAQTVARMFRERPDRLSLCYHGNDHTAGEFRSGDAIFLNSALKVAASRMRAHEARTRIRHDDVMVFPQGGFSTQALRALQANNFVAAVNSGGYPYGEPNTLTLADLMQPAVTKFGFPVFFRHYVRDFSPAEMALHRLFGKPLLVGEHHEIFREPERLTALVSAMRSVTPDVRWSNVQTAVENAVQYRRAADGAIRVRAFANQAIVHNDWAVSQEHVVERHDVPAGEVDHVELDGARRRHESAADGALTFACPVDPGATRTCRIVFRDDRTTPPEAGGVRWRARVFARRRLSEFRDMYLSRVRHAMFGAS